MAPLRRYLRITKYSILEVRIYLDNPADLHRWLIHPQKPVLPDILAAVKPFVLPKLREENARAGGKKSGSGTGSSGAAKPKGKKGVRDVVVTDSFEVSIFLTELSTPHAVLLRTRHFTAKESPDRRTGTKDLPVIVQEEDDADDEDADVQLIRPDVNSSNEPQEVKLEDGLSETGSPSNGNTTRVIGEQVDDAQSVSSNEVDELIEEEDEKKKLGLKTSYEGFKIYGRILCLVVKRKGQQSNTSTSRHKSNQRSTVAASGDNQPQAIAEMVQRTASSGQQRDEGILEGWMRSTQIGNDSGGIAGGVGDLGES